MTQLELLTQVVSLSLPHSLTHSLSHSRTLAFSLPFYNHAQRLNSYVQRCTYEKSWHASGGQGALPLRGANQIHKKEEEEEERYWR